MFFRRKSRREVLLDQLREQPKVLLARSGDLIEIGREKSGELLEKGRDVSSELLHKGHDLSAELLHRGHDLSAQLLDRGRDVSSDLIGKGRETSVALLERVHPKPKPKHRGRRALYVAGAGTAIFFLDPQRGPARRARAKQRATQLVRTVQSKVYGMRQRMAHPAPETLDYNDATLTAKVESELFQGHDIPRDRIKINSENGIVVLRGEVDEPGQIKELERAAAKIPGVQGVRTLLHLPGEDAPNKAEAINAG
jgi:hypothetical protein